MGPTRVNRKLSFESGEEQIKGYGKVTQNTEIFSTKYGNNILEVGSPVVSPGEFMILGQPKFKFWRGEKKLCDEISFSGLCYEPICKNKVKLLNA